MFFQLTPFCIVQVACSRDRPASCVVSRGTLAEEVHSYVETWEGAPSAVIQLGPTEDGAFPEEEFFAIFQCRFGVVEKPEEAIAPEGGAGTVAQVLSYVAGIAATLSSINNAVTEARANLEDLQTAEAADILRYFMIRRSSSLALQRRYEWLRRLGFEEYQNAGPYEITMFRWIPRRERYSQSTALGVAQVSSEGSSGDSDGGTGDE